MVYRIIRPDSSEVWKNEEILTKFSRYRDIIEDKQIARYLIAKSIPCEYNLDDPLQQLENLLQETSMIFNNVLQQPKDNHANREIYSQNYISLAETIANKYLEECIFCERKCKVNRIDNEKGYCLINKDSYVSSAFLHMGEESPLIPSGTIFFTGCNFGCVFCQNYDISQSWKAKRELHDIAQKTDAIKLSKLAESLAERGAININYVGGDPIPNIHTIIGNLNFQTSNITQLWNSNLFLSNEGLSLIIDLMDFWLPDFKYGCNECGEKYSGIEHYYDILTRNLKRIHDDGSGEIIIRHLVMPNHIECCSIPILEYIAKELPKATVNIMGQFRPEFNAHKYKEINRRPSMSEMHKVKDYADKLEILWKPVS
jgi:putative pyruvate formate lyase activating enzyme